MNGSDKCMTEMGGGGGGGGRVVFLQIVSVFGADITISFTLSFLDLGMICN